MFTLFKAFLKIQIWNFLKNVSAMAEAIAFSHFRFEFCVVFPLGKVANYVIIFQ